MEGLKNGSIDYKVVYEPLFHPIFQELSIYPMEIMASDRFVAATFYNCSEEKSIQEQRQTEFMESFKSFDSIVWLITFLLAIVISGLVSKHMKWNGISSYTPSGNGNWIFITYILNQPCMKEVNAISSILSMVICSYVFFIVINCFGNCIKSGKISKYQPTIYTDYHDIIRNDDILIYSYPFAANRLKKSKITSHVEIYQHIMNIGERYKEYRPYQMAASFSDELFNHDIVVIGSSIFLEHFREEFCNEQMDDGNGRIGMCFHIAYNSIDDSDAIIAIAASDRFKDKPIYENYMKYFRMSIETGLKRKQRSLYYFQREPIITPDTYACKTNEIVTYDPDPLPFELINYRHTMSYLMILFTIGCIRLHYEILKPPKRMNVRRKQRVAAI